MNKKKDTFIQVDYYLFYHAKRAYADGYFIEAIQVIHGCIERQVRELIFDNRSTPGPHEYFDLAYDLMLEIPLNVAEKVLFMQQILSRKERDRILEFNKTGNIIIHKIYFDTANGSWHGYPKSQYDKAFNDALKSMILLEGKIIESNS